MSNSPLAPSGPASIGAIPSAAGASTAGMSCAWVIRQGNEVSHLPTLTLPRTASATSSTHSSALQAGVKFHLSRSNAVSIAGALSSRSSSAAELSRRSSLPGTIGRPSAPAISPNVGWPGAAMFTGPLSMPVSTIDRTKIRCTSSVCTTCTLRRADPLMSGNSGEANTRRTQLLTSRPRMAAERIATHSAPHVASFSSTWALSRPSTVTGFSRSASDSAGMLSRSVPYTFADEAKTIRRVPLWAIASSTLAVPPMLISRSADQAQCATTSAPATAPRTPAASRMSLCTKSAVLGQLSGR